MGLTKRRTSYVAILEGPFDKVQAVGPYLSMKRAERLVESWTSNNVKGYVVILEKESDFLKGNR